MTPSHNSASARVTRVLKAMGVFLAGSATLLMASSANAYTGEIHHRIGDQAFQMLNLVRRGQVLADIVSRQTGQSVPPLTAFPSTLPASQMADWNRFIADAATAAGKLDLLLSDLPDPTNPSAQCANAFPTGTPLRNCRAGELPFVPDRNFGNPNTTACNFVTQYFAGWNHRPEIYEGVQHSLTGGLLGYYAMQPDDLVGDTDIFLYPLDVLGLGAVNEALVDSVDVGVAIFIAPIALFVDLFSGGDPFKDALRDAHNLDPVPYLDTLVPGIPGTDLTGNVFGVQLAGMWHFLNVQLPTGQFNNVPGLRFDTGGFLGNMDSLDAALIVTTDISGYAVNPDKSNGTKNYVQFEDGPERRRKGDWLYGIAHTEFEPLDNLAQFGLNLTVNSTDSSARGLGWALHAVGDAACPQHTISSPGWGHQVYEAYVQDYWEEPNGVGHQDSAHAFDRYMDLVSIIADGFKYWRFMDQIQAQRQTTTVPIRELVIQLANDTFNAASGANMFIPEISLPYAAEVLTNFSSGQKETEALFYGSSTSTAQSLVESGTGAGMALLAKTANVIHVSSQMDPCQCTTPGQALVGINLAGRPIASPTCKSCGQDVFSALPVLLDGVCVTACPSDKPFNQGGVCVATCTGTCTGTACPATQPFVNQGQCVSSCPPGLKIVNNRECASTCPSGQAESPAGSGYCLPLSPPDPRICNSGSAGDSTGACRCQSDDICGGVPNRCVAATCCVGTGGACDGGNVCCSLVCGATGTCLAGTGENCSSNAACASGTCQNGKCVGDPKDAACRQNSDCASGDCRQGQCFGGLGDPCNGNGGCSQGTCSNGKCCIANGVSCANNADCCEGDCSSGLCRGALGDPCTQPAECASGTCESNGEIAVCCLEAGPCSQNADCCGVLVCSGGICQPPGTG